LKQDVPVIHTQRLAGIPKVVLMHPGARLRQMHPITIRGEDVLN
jgi:hypothetical protein